MQNLIYSNELQINEILVVLEHRQQKFHWPLTMEILYYLSVGINFPDNRQFDISITALHEAYIFYKQFQCLMPK